jgi:D-arabinose 1-dehydrogenase-like Zn-dependent alcohol dehydrogenase
MPVERFENEFLMTNEPRTTDHGMWCNSINGRFKTLMNVKKAGRPEEDVKIDITYSGVCRDLFMPQRTGWMDRASSSADMKIVVGEVEG